MTQEILYSLLKMSLWFRPWAMIPEPLDYKSSALPIELERNI